MSMNLCNNFTVFDKVVCYEALEIVDPEKSMSTIRRSVSLPGLLVESNLNNSEQDDLIQFEEKPQLTSVVLRNIPCKYTQDNLWEMITLLPYNVNFLYLPLAKRSKNGKRNAGYAFLNFTTQTDAECFMVAFNDFVWPEQHGDVQKRATAEFAQTQGLHANLEVSKTQDKQAPIVIYDC